MSSKKKRSDVPLDVESVGILFPGQGAQNVGMGRWLCENYPTARGLFDQAADVLGYDLARICFDGPDEKLHATEFGQPALFVTGIAAATVLAETRPELMARIKSAAGLSLGEYTAVCFAGGLAIRRRSAFGETAWRGHASRIRCGLKWNGQCDWLGPGDVERLCEQCRSADEVLVTGKSSCARAILPISGHLSAIERLVPAASEAGSDEGHSIERCRCLSHVADGTCSR